LRCLHSVHASVIFTLTFGTSYFLAFSGIIASLSRGIADLTRLLVRKKRTKK